MLEKLLRLSLGSVNVLRLHTPSLLEDFLLNHDGMHCLLLTSLDYSHFLDRPVHFSNVPRDDFGLSYEYLLNIGSQHVVLVIKDEPVQELDCDLVNMLLTLCDQLDEILSLTATEDDLGTNENLEQEDSERVHV